MLLHSNYMHCGKRTSSILEFKMLDPELLIQSKSESETAHSVKMAVIHKVQLGSTAWYNSIISKGDY